MIIVVTQNKAIVNISNFRTIYVDVETEDNQERYLVTDGTYVFGVYKTRDDALRVIDWLAEGLAKGNSSETTCMVMPLIVGDANEEQA